MRLQVIEPRRRYQTTSQSQDDTVYTLSRERDGWACTCPGFTHARVCKHIAALKMRAEREGWAPKPPSASDDDYARNLAVALLRGPR